MATPHVREFLLNASLPHPCQAWGRLTCIVLASLHCISSGTRVHPAAPRTPTPPPRDTTGKLPPRQTMATAPPLAYTRYARLCCTPPPFFFLSCETKVSARRHETRCEVWVVYKLFVCVDAGSMHHGWRSEGFFFVRVCARGVLAVGCTPLPATRPHCDCMAWVWSMIEPMTRL